MMLVAVLLLLIASNVVCELSEDEDESFQNSDRRRLEKESEIISALLRGYDPLMRPVGDVLYGKFRPVVVKLDVFIRSIPRVDDLRMEYDADITLRQRWKDDRLGYSKEGPDMVTLRELEKIWKPDTFIRTELSARRHMIDQENSLLRIKRDGSVFYSTRIFLTSFCSMDFSDFPFDNQTCDLNFQSYGFTQDDIVYTWDEEMRLRREVSHDIPLFKLTNITYDGGQEKVVSSENRVYPYSYLKIVFHFDRKFGYYQHQLFTPVAMLVTISFIAFFIHPSKVTARVLLGVSTVFALIILSCFMNVSFPKTSYVRAVDIWIGVSLLFVFHALIVTVMVTYFYVEKQKGCCDGLPGDAEEHLISTPAGKWSARKRQKSIVCRVRDTLARQSLKADAFSRILFPVLYAVFAIIFFLIYAVF